MDESLRRYLEMVHPQDATTDIREGWVVHGGSDSGSTSGDQYEYHVRTSIFGCVLCSNQRWR